MEKTSDCLVATWTDPMDLHPKSLSHRASLHPSSWAFTRCTGSTPKLGVRQESCVICPEGCRVFPKCQAAVPRAWVQTSGKPLWSIRGPHRVHLSSPLQLQAGRQGGGRPPKVHEASSWAGGQTELPRNPPKVAGGLESREPATGCQAGSWTLKQRWLESQQCSTRKACWREAFETRGHVNLTKTATRSRQSSTEKLNWASPPHQQPEQKGFTTFFWW